MAIIKKQLLGYCGDANAEFPLPLRNLLEVNRDGYVQFCYPYEVGVYNSETRHANELLQFALKLKGKSQAKALREAADFVARVCSEHNLISQQWDTHCDVKRAGARAKDAAVA